MIFAVHARKLERFSKEEIIALHRSLFVELFSKIGYESTARKAPFTSVHVNRLVFDVELEIPSGPFCRFQAPIHKHALTADVQWVLEKEETSEPGNI